MQKRILFSVVLLLIFATIVGFNIPLLTENLFSTSFKLDSPYKAIMDSEKNSYIIDMSKRRVIKIDADNRLLFEIDGGLRKEGTFFYANDLAVDSNGNLYILNLIPDNAGFYTKREEILKFSPEGKFLSKIYEKQYDEERTTLVQRGEFLSLIFRNGELSWFALGDDGVVYYQLNLEKDNRVSSRKLLHNGANIMFYDVKAIDENRWIFSTKQGEIKVFDFQKKEYTSNTMVSEQANYLKVCYSLFVDNDLNVYFTDIGGLSLYQYTIGDGGIGEKRIFSVDELEGVDRSIFYFVNIIENDGEKILTSAINNSIIHYDLVLNKLIDNVDKIEYKTSHIIERTAIYLAALLSLFLIIYLVIILYKYRLKGRIPKILYTISSMIIIVAVATSLIVTIMISNFSKRYEDVVIEKSSLMVQLISKGIDGDLFENIKSQKDFMGSDYQKIRNDLQGALNYNKDKWNSGYYFAVYRLIDDAFCGFMYLSDEIGPTHPFMGWYEEDESIPSLAFHGDIAHEKDQDEFGTWIYSMGPIKNSKGEVVAIIEIGTDLYSFNQENKKLVQGILLDVITMLIVLILTSVEIIYFAHLLTRKKEFELSNGFDLPDGGSFFSYSSFVRPFNFIYSLAISMSIAFVPIMMKNLYVEFLSSGALPLFGLPSDVVIALPISIEMLFFGIGLLIGGSFISKMGWRFLQIVGIIFAFVGLLLSGYSANIYMFLISRGVLGFGSGLVLLTSRSIINLEKDPIIKSSAYSNFYSGGLAGVTVGAVFGGFFADRFGFSNVFYIASVFAVVAFIFAYQILISNKSIINKVIKSVSEKLSFVSALKFLFNIKVLSYFLLAIIPTYAAGMFLSYYLPLFAESKGLNISDIGRLFMLNGLLIIYLGPVVSSFVKKSVKDDRLALILGSAGWAVSLIIFAVTGNILGLVLTLIVMGITEGFCVVAQNDYFLDLRIVKEIGEDIAVSYFEVAVKIAEILAPIIFGWVLIMGEKKGMWVFGIAILVAAALFFIISNIKEGRKNE